MKKNISETLRFILILLFIYTAYHKLIDLNHFESTLMKSTLIEGYQIKYLLYFVPIIEIVTILFLIQKKYLIGLYLSFFLMLTFTIYLVVLNNFSFYKGCSCGGIFNELSYLEHIIVNVSLILTSLISILIYDEVTLTAKK